MRFRPRLWPTLMALPAFCALIALGVWQLERREWKLQLIATMDARLREPEVPLATLEKAGKDIGYRPVLAEGVLDHEKSLYWITPGPHGEPGLHVLTPLIPAAGPPVIVDRGFVPVQLKDRVSRPAGSLTLHGIARDSQAGGAFTPADAPAQRLVFTRDVPHMARLMGLEKAAPFFIEEARAPGPAIYPLGGQTHIQLRNEHLQYALTWFGLAGALLIVYLLYHRGRRQD